MQAGGPISGRRGRPRAGGKPRGRGALRFATVAWALAAPALAFAQVPSLEEQLARTEVTSQRLGDGFHVLFGVGGNIAVSIGEQGVLIVDDQFPEMVPKYKAAIRELGGGDILFAINTHWHYNHANGNLTLGPEGTLLISHANSRQMMTRDKVINLVALVREQPAYPASALPAMTFENKMRLHFNGEQIDLLHFGAAHTTGDAAVVFRRQNAVHMGDVFHNAAYPFIDADNGGSLDGLIAFCEAVLAEIDESTIVIPGHGPVASYAELRAYVAMLGTIRARIAALVRSGATLEQVFAARPTAEWDAQRGDPLRMVDRAYASLSRR